MFYVNLPKNVDFIINRLNEHGYRADVVGGAIRDLCIGRSAGDYDITTSATPDKIKEIFSDVRTIDTGIRHGTVTVHIDGENYEVTTYRRDGEYKDARHPESVEFTTRIEDDLSRRDFTVNAMCYNHHDGITDIFGGCDDIKARVIRTVGNAEDRFSEDALRILRALRFASVLDFTMDTETERAVHKLKGLLRMVSRERIYTEWYKLCSGIGAHRIISENLDVIAEFIPALENAEIPPYDKFTVADTVTRMISLFSHLTDAPSAFDTSMRELKTDNKIRLYGKSVLELNTDFSPASERDILFALSKYGRDVVSGAISLRVVLGRASASEQMLLDRAIDSGVPYTIGALAVGGADILSLGYRGEKVGACLASLLRSVMSGECKNEREALLSHVTQMSNNT